MALIAAALAFGSWTAWNVPAAQETASNGERSLAVVAKDANKCGALLVGVDEYETLTPLEYASSDVRKLRDALVEIGFPNETIRTFVSDGRIRERPSRERILAALDEILTASGPDSTVLIALSGHGFETEKGVAAFCPEDVEAEKKDGKTIVKTETAILIEEIAERLRADDARFKLLIVDACREPASTEKGTSAKARSFSPIPEANGVAFLQSCETQELSWEHPELGGGVFTHFFAEGLRGAADADGDGGVSFLDVCNYATSRTQRFVKDKNDAVQTPFYRLSGVVDFWLKKPTRAPGLPVAVAPPGGRTGSGSGWLPLALLTLTGGFALWAFRLQTQMMKFAAIESGDETTLATGPDGETNGGRDAADASRSTVATTEAELARPMSGETELAKLRQEKEAALAAAKTNAEEIKAREAASQAEEAKKIKEPASTTAKVATQGRKAEATNALSVESKAGTRKTILINGVELAFRYCPAGTFWTGGSAGETRRKATLTHGFWTLETPVTQGMFAAVLGKNPSHFSSSGRGRGNVNGMETSNFPVESVSWNDCVAFVKSLNDGGYLQAGFEFRLPTEVEWEYAARAGAETSFPWGESLNGDRANCNGTLPYGTNAQGSYWRRTTAVRSYPPNAWGLYDVVGNVWEQCADDGETLEHGDEKKAPTGYKRVLRGGSWLNYPQNCRIACRKWEFAATAQDYANGFRVVIARRVAAAESVWETKLEKERREKETALVVAAKLRQEKEAAERRAKEEVERRAREAAERAESERRAREEAERRAREAAERAESERRAREEAEHRAREAAERAESERRAREEAERRANEAAERAAAKRREQAKADYLLGRELAFGLNGTKVDGRRGVEFLTKAADAGSVDAKAELAELYWSGCEGTPVDMARAYGLAFEAAQSENPFALDILGDCYKEGRVVAKDEKQAAAYYARAFRGFEKRAEDGDVRAKTKLGAALLYGIGCSEDEDAGFQLTGEAAETGCAEAMNCLAWCYNDGKGVAKDECLAFEWLRKAAEAGNANAMYFLAWRYDLGKGVAKDKRLAFEWYRKAANAGFPEAMASLACCYKFGKGVEEDEAKAFEWFHKGANAGNAAAMWQLGDCYKDGIGVGKDTTRAFAWYRKAANVGHALSMCRVGDCYKDGIGVGKDTKQAFEWYRKGANAGFSEAAYLLGKCYEKGVGVEKNVAEAINWYRKAAEQERYLLWKTEAEEALRRLEGEADVAKPTLFDALPLFAASESASSACEPAPKAGTRKTFRVRDVEFAFRYCPSGTFLMGSPASEKGRKEDETQHEVTLTRGFWTLETPVTQRMFEAITGENPSWFSLNGGGWEKILELDDYDTSEFPVERVDMRACQRFLDLLSEIHKPNAGWEFRLPTEAEWEYACRAGTSTPYYWGERWGARLVNCAANASYGGVKWERTTPVGYYQPNAWGLYDMLGNVFEWRGEYYDAYPNGSATDPTGPLLGVKGVLRGGCWRGDEKFCRAAARHAADTKRRRYRYGFRFVIARR